jgi:hypothetical protein
MGNHRTFGNSMYGWSPPSEGQQFAEGVIQVGVQYESSGNSQVLVLSSFSELQITSRLSQTEPRDLVHHFNLEFPDAL